MAGTPLASIQHAAELLSETKLDSAQRELLDAVVVASQMMMHETRKVMDFQKCQQGAAALRWTPVPGTKLRAHVEDILTMLKVIGQNAGVSFEWEIGKEIPEKLTTDPVWCLMPLLLL